MFMVDIPDGEFNNNDADWLNNNAGLSTLLEFFFFYRSAGNSYNAGPDLPGRKINSQRRKTGAGCMG